MTLATSGAYRSTTDEHKVRIMTQQGHVLKLDGAAGTAAIIMDGKQYVNVVAIYQSRHHVHNAM